MTNPQRTTPPANVPAAAALGGNPEITRYAGPGVPLDLRLTERGLSLQAQPESLRLAAAVTDGRADNQPHHNKDSGAPVVRAVGQEPHGQTSEQAEPAAHDGRRQGEPSRLLVEPRGVRLDDTLVVLDHDSTSGLKGAPPSVGAPPLLLASAALHRALTAHQLTNAAAALEAGLYRASPEATAALLREAAALLSGTGL